MNKYLVALETGGILEDPDLKYFEYDIINAKNNKDALKTYNKTHNCKFYYGCIMATKINNNVEVNNKRITWEQLSNLLRSE